jgi:hypothetical protein
MIFKLRAEQFLFCRFSNIICARPNIFTALSIVKNPEGD